MHADMSPMETRRAKTLPNSPLNLLVGKIHRAYTTAADELFLRGYMGQEARMAFGGFVGKLLTGMREAVLATLPELSLVMVDPDCVDVIAEQKEGRRNSTGDSERLQQIHDLAVENGAVCPFMVTKGADGRWRWVLFSSTTFEDRDGEIVSQKAQEADCAAMAASGEYGPLRWWHVGEPVYTQLGDWRTVKAGDGLDIGDCDFSAMHGKVRIESGTFRDEAIGQRTKELAEAGELEVSIAFSHPMTEPRAGGVFDHTHTFERSVLTAGNASNLFTDVPFVGKENSMESNKVDEFKKKFGAAGDAVVSLLLGRAKDKQTTAEVFGVRNKAMEAVKAGEKFTLGNDVFVRSPSPLDPQAVYFAVKEMVDEPPAEAAADEPPAEGPKKVADLTIDELMTLIGTVVEGKMGAAQKEASTVATSLKAIADKAEASAKALAELKTVSDAQAQKVDFLFGGMPRSVLAGFRASQDPATARKETPSAPPAPTADPIGALVDAMDGVYINVPPGTVRPPGEQAR